MKLKMLLVFACLIGSAAVYGGDDPKYPVSAIPEALLKNVDVVYRVDHMKFTIHSKNKASYHVHQAITILNGNGKDYAYETVGYDKLSKVTSFKGFVYDVNGKLITKLKASDIYDQSVFDGSLYGDNRFKRADLSQGTYPYTVEFEYEIEYKFLFFVPGFHIPTSQKASVEHSDYLIIFPEALRPRYKAFNIDVKPVEKTTNDGMQSLYWSFENLPAVEEEVYADYTETDQFIRLAPNTFEYDGYGGSMESWKSYGEWIQSLNKGRDVLPEATIKKVKELTANAKTIEEKVKIVYEFMQGKTRYVSIQLGIGGYQPFEAQVVDKTGYGDCKALSNYTVAMLKNIGINANYTLVDSGPYAGPMQEDFPSSQFDHVIVAVPNERDTLWLECTSQTNPFGFQGHHTGDRKALMITDDGAKVVNTTRYTVDQNLKSRHALVEVDLTGNAKAKVKTEYGGLQYENAGLSFVLDGQYDKQKEWLEHDIDIPSFNLNKFSFVNHKSKVPVAEINADLTLNRYASVSGKRLFLVPNLMNRWSLIPEKDESRKTNIFLRSAFTDLDTIEFKVPGGIYPEFLPPPVKLKSRFGEYEARFEMSAEKLVYTRKLKMYKGKYPAASYQEFTDFLKSVNKSDNTKIVFINKT